jgi:hypothetical protein
MSLRKTPLSSQTQKKMKNVRGDECHDESLHGAITQSAR